MNAPATPRDDGTPRMLVAATMPGTIEAFLLPYIDRLKTLGWVVDAATGHEIDGDDLLDHVDAVWRIPWSRQAAKPTNAALAFWRMRRVLQRGGYDILHTHTPVASAVARLAVASLPKRCRPKVVYTAHGFHFGRSIRNGWPQRAIALVERATGRWTDRLVVINDEDSDNALDHKLVPADRLVQMPGIGVDPCVYRPSPELDAAAQQQLRTLGLDAASPLFTMVAHFDARKNHRAVLEALALMERTDVHVAFAGRGALEAEVKAQAAERGLGDRLHFLGSVADPRPLMLASIATLLPSRREGLSRAVLESLSLGVPVIGADVRGIAELVRPDGGIVVAPDDHEGLAAAMEAMIVDRSAHFVRDAVAQRMRVYATDLLLDRHVELYGQLIRPKRVDRTGVR